MCCVSHLLALLSWHVFVLCTCVRVSAFLVGLECLLLFLLPCCLSCEYVRVWVLVYRMVCAQACHGKVVRLTALSLSLLLSFLSILFPPPFTHSDCLSLLRSPDSDSQLEVDVARRTHKLFSKILIGQAIPHTLVYWAPELLRLESYGLPADIWAFGVTLFQLVTGELPFDIENEENFRDDVMTASINWEPLQRCGFYFLCCLVLFVEPQNSRYFVDTVLWWARFMFGTLGRPEILVVYCAPPSITCHLEVPVAGGVDGDLPLLRHPFSLFSPSK